MEKEKMIPASEFCHSHQIELTVLHSFRNYELVELSVIEEELFIPYKELPLLEKLLRMHVDLGINFEGIETILHLLERMKVMQQHAEALRNKLLFYESQPG